MIPNDPIILLSYINTQLRDNYSSFEQLCDDKQLCADEIISKLSSVDYHYDEKRNQFR